MALESKMVVKWVRATLTQLGVDTQPLEITVTGTTVQIRGELKRLKAGLMNSDKGERRLLEQINQRLRSHKAIKRVMFL